MNSSPSTVADALEGVVRPTAGEVHEVGCEVPLDLSGAAGHAVYALRKTIVEPVFGQIKDARGFRRFSFRGLPKVQAEWLLIYLTHNLMKLFWVGWTPLGQVVTETDIDGQRSDVLGCAEAAVAAAVGVVGGGKAIARIIADRLFGQANIAAEAVLQRLADHGCHHGPIGGDVIHALP